MISLGKGITTKAKLKEATREDKTRGRTRTKENFTLEEHKLFKIK